MISSLRDPETPLFVLNSPPIRFFPRPYINIGSMKAEKVAHVSMRQRMLVIRPARPLHNSSRRRFAIRVDKLPITCQLAGGHPFRDRIG